MGRGIKPALGAPQMTCALASSCNPGKSVEAEGCVFDEHLDVDVNWHDAHQLEERVNRPTLAQWLRSQMAHRRRALLPDAWARSIPRLSFIAPRIPHPLTVSSLSRTQWPFLIGRR